jgi:hypothetical protein
MGYLILMLMWMKIAIIMRKEKILIAVLITLILFLKLFVLEIFCFLNMFRNLTQKNLGGLFLKKNIDILLVMYVMTVEFEKIRTFLLTLFI